MDPFTHHKLIKKTGLAEALDLFVHAVTLANANDQLVYVNPAFHQLYGWSAEEVIGVKPEILVPGSYSKTELASVRRTMNGAKLSWVGALLNRRRDGTTLTVKLATFKISLLEHLAPNLFLGVALDQGEVAQAIDELVVALCRQLFRSKRTSRGERMDPKPLPRHLQILRMHQHGYTTKEIAAFLGVDINTPNVILHRARRKRM